MAPAVDDAVALTEVVPDTVEPADGPVIVAVTGEAVTPLIFSEVATTSKVLVPWVHARPIWLLLAAR